MPTWNTMRSLSCQLFIIITILVAYHNTFDSPFVFDDEINITKNSFIRIESLGGDSLKKVFSSYNPSASRPVANLTFALNYLAGGYDPFGFHLVNILIHCLTSILLYRLFLWYLGRGCYADGDAERIALAAVLVWALNPVQTNAVTYIVQRMTSLCTFFLIASLLLYVHARQRNERRGQGTGVTEIGRYLPALLFWCLALLTKELAVIMPIILLLHERFFFTGLQWENIRARKYLFLFAGAGALVLFLFLWPWFSALVIGGYSQRDFTLTERLLTQSRVVFRYISLFLAPLPSRLTIFYDYPVSRSLLEPITTLWSMAGILLLFGAAVLTAARNRLVSFCILWMFTCLLVESTVVPLELIFEHRFYLPSIGLALGIVLLTYQAFRRMTSNNILFNCFWIGTICLLTGLTIARNNDWRSEISIYSDAAAKAPKLMRAVNTLGVAYARAGRFKEAEQTFLGGLEEEPRDIAVLANLFTLYTRQGDPSRAETYFDKLKLAVAGGKVKCVEGFNLLLVSEVLKEQGRYADIIFLLTSLADCPGRNGRYHDILGLCYSRTGDYVNAAAHFRQAVSFEPENPYFLFSLARAYVYAGDREKALAVYQQLQALRMPEELQQPFSQLGQYLGR